MRDSRTYRASRRNLWKLTKRTQPDFQWNKMFSWENPDLSHVPSPATVLHALAIRSSVR